MTTISTVEFLSYLRTLDVVVSAEGGRLRVNGPAGVVTPEIQKRTVDRLKNEYTQFIGRRVKNIDRTDGLKLEFEDGAWLLMRLSGTEPLLRLYTEASSAGASAKIADETRKWIFDTSAH